MRNKLLAILIAIAALACAPAAHAQVTCNPPQAPLGSLGCYPNVVTQYGGASGSDIIGLWRSSTWPNSSLSMTLTQLGQYLGVGSGGGTVNGPTSSTSGYVPQWNNTLGTLLGTGLPVGTTGNSTIVETSSGGTLAASILPQPTATTLGGIESITSATNNFLTYIDTSGVPHQAQPSFSNLSGSATCSQQPALTGSVTTSAGSCATTIASSGVSAGSYTNTNLTVGADGRITAASNGSSGGGSIPVNAQTGTSYTIVSADMAGKIVTFANTSGVSVTLPQATTSGFGATTYVYLRNNSTGLVTITPTTSTIGGQTAWYLQNGDNVLVISDGTNYQVVSQRGMLNSSTGFSLQVPDGAATGGNARGQYAADLQLTRAAATQVAGAKNTFAAGGDSTASAEGAAVLGESNTASGTEAMGFGYDNTASGNYSATLGDNNTASAQASIAFGEYNTSDGIEAVVIGNRGKAHGNYGALVHTPYQSSTLAQTEDYVFAWNTITGSSTSKQLTTNANNPTTNNIGNLANNTVVEITIHCVTWDYTATKGYTFYLTNGIISRGANAAATSIGTSSTSLSAGATSSSPGTAPTMTLAADTTNGGPNITFTTPSGNSDGWDVSCHVVYTQDAD